MVSPSFTFINSTPNSVYAADDATNFKIVKRVKISPVGVMGSPSLGNEPSKKWPDVLLLVFFVDGWYASECMFNTMSDA